MTIQRQEAFQRNEDLERLLAELAELLGPGEQVVETTLERPRHPVVLVIGVPRSGTSLMLQWLAHSGLFSYPSNLIARFFATPYLGARIQQLLFDPKYDFRGELAGLSREMDWSSDLGKTRGALAPNEFWYMWRRFIPNTEPRPLSKEEESRIDSAGLLRALAALEAPFDLPLAMKGMILQFNLRRLAEMLERVVFLWIRRHPLFNMQSLLESREKYWGTREQWYSVRPAETVWLTDLDPLSQVAGQVFFTEKALRKSFEELDDDLCLTVSYEEFCNQPQNTFRHLCDKLARHGYELPRTYGGPSSFHTMNELRLTDREVDHLTRSWKDLGGDDFVRPTG